ncbi:hypothetical protein AB7W40_09975 [Providencia rettgeri]
MRKQEHIIISETNRDEGKHFILTEKPALECHQIAQDLYKIIMDNDYLNLPPDVIQMGSAGLATIGLSVLASSGSEISKALTAELLKDVEIVVNHEGKDVSRKLNVALDIEEVSTINTLLDRAFYLNIGFVKIDRD